MTTLLAQLGAAVPTSPWEMVVHANLLTQIVLAVLVVLSIISWMIMFAKWRQLRAVFRAGARFMREFERAAALEEVASLARRSQPSPFTRVFTRALNFFAEMKPGALREIAGTPLSGSQVEALRLVLDAETAGERDRFGRYIPSLAVIGTSSPLIGLLGTVLGVIDAFVSLRHARVASVRGYGDGVVYTAGAARRQDRRRGLRRQQFETIVFEQGFVVDGFGRRSVAGLRRERSPSARLARLAVTGPRAGRCRRGWSSPSRACRLRCRG